MLNNDEQLLPEGMSHVRGRSLASHGLKHGNVDLRGNKALNVGLVGEEVVQGLHASGSLYVSETHLVS